MTVACYALKSPIMAYRVIRRKDQTVRLRKTRNSFKGHLQLFRILQGFEHVDTMAAGGQGTDVARGIRRLCAKYNSGDGFQVSETSLFRRNSGCLG